MFLLFAVKIKLGSFVVAVSLDIVMPVNCIASTAIWFMEAQTKEAKMNKC